MKKFTCIAIACIVSAVVAGNACAKKVLDTTKDIATTAATTTAHLASQTETIAVNNHQKQSQFQNYVKIIATLNALVGHILYC